MTVLNVNHPQPEDLTDHLRLLDTLHNMQEQAHEAALEANKLEPGSDAYHEAVQRHLYLHLILEGKPVKDVVDQFDFWQECRRKLV